MMFDISKLNSQSSTTLNSLQGQTTKELSGPLAKLSSELKLIASLESIKINSTRDIIFQQKPAQILDVSTKSKQNFNLINTQQKIEVQPGDTVELQVQKNSHRAILSLFRQNAPPITTKTPSQAEPSTSTLRPENTNTGKASPAITQNPVTFSTGIQKNLQSTLTTNSASNFPSKTLVSTTSNGVLPQNTSSINSVSLSEIKLSVNIISKTIPLTVLSVSQIVETTTSISNKLSTPPQTTQAQSVPEPDKNVTLKNVSSSPSTPNAINQPKPQQVMTNNLDPSHQKITMDTQTHSLRTSTQEPSFLVEVNDGEETFTLKTQHRPEIGSKIPVMIDPKGQVQLVPNEVIQRPTAPIEDGLKISLPKQLNLQEMTQFIKQLETLSQSNQLGSEKIQQTLTKLITNIPTLSALTTTPEALKQSIQQSGLFLENNLAKELPEIEKDMKLNLLKLQAAVSETSSSKLPPQFELVEKAIERITTNQLKHLVDTVRTESQTFPLHMELPIKHGTSSSFVQFEIDKDTNDREELSKEKRRWLVKLKFDFPETGKIEARLSIQETKAGIIFVAENRETEQKIRSQLSTIRENLKKKDIELESLDCFCAPLVDEQKTMITKRLIDVRT